MEELLEQMLCVSRTRNRAKLLLREIAADQTLIVVVSLSVIAAGGLARPGAFCCIPVMMVSVTRVVVLAVSRWERFVVTAPGMVGVVQKGV